MGGNDILLYLLLVTFTAGITVNQKQQFTIILQLIAKKNDLEKANMNFDEYSDITQKDNDITVVSGDIPFDNTTVKRYYHDEKDSILRNLPNPTITSIDNHGYVSVRQSTVDFLGKGDYPE